jgi:hypothetical protein
VIDFTHIDPSTIVTILALIVALISTVVAFKTDHRSIEIDTYNRATELFLKLNEIFIDHSKLRPFFYDGRSLEDAADPEERERVLAVAEMVLDIFDWVGHECEGASDIDRESWESFIRATFLTSPVLVDYHRVHPDWHPVLEELLSRESGPLPRKRGTRRRASFSLQSRTSRRVR